jgi:spore maturation protein SpmA
MVGMFALNMRWYFNAVIKNSFSFHCLACKLSVQLFVIICYFLNMLCVAHCSGSVGRVTINSIISDNVKFLGP